MFIFVAMNMPPRRPGADLRKKNTCRPIHRVVTSQSLWSRYDRHFVGITRQCVELKGEDLSSYSNKIEPVS